MNKIEEIQKLKSLLNQEAITQDEYNLLKKNILKKNDDQQTSIGTSIITIGKSGNSQSKVYTNIEDTTQSEQNQSPKDFTQKTINDLVATTDEFWSSFHQSLALPYSNYNNYKNDSFDKWVKRVSRTPDLKIHLNILFEYVLLKGEFLIVFYEGFILTNYRLIINDESSGKPSIPLSDLKRYNAKGDGSIKYENNGEPITLNYSRFLSEAYVNPAKARFKKQELNEVQLELLSKSISELKMSNPNLEIPEVDLNPSIIGIQNTEVQTNKETSTQKAKKKDINAIQPKKNSKAFIWLFLIGSILVFLYTVNPDSSSNNSSSSSGSSGSENRTKHCRYCGKEYSGAGYYHFMDKCESSTEYDDMCTQKCCYESWNATHKR